MDHGVFPHTLVVVYKYLRSCIYLCVVTPNGSVILTI